MFSDQKKTRQSSNSNEQNRIAAGTVITGDVSAKGCFRIEGTLEGNLKTPGKVVISEGGLINGTLECGNADIEGNFRGKLVVSEVLSLKSAANIEGEVYTSKLSIEPGAVFNATCQMNGAVKKLKKEDEKRSA